MLKKVTPWLIVGVLVVLLIWLLNVDSGEPQVIEKHITDTLVVHKIDTITITEVVYKTKPADTVYIRIRDSINVPVPRQEYNFSEPNLFDFSVRGFGVEFLGATVYPKTEYRTIIETKETTTIKYKSSLFLNAGFASIGGVFSPMVGASLSLKGKWLISGDIGLYQKQPLYLAKIGYNILEK